MGKTYYVAYQGINIFYMDFSGLRVESEIVSVINEAKQHIRSQRPKSVVALTNIDEMHFNNTIKELFMDFVKGNREYIRASAIVGVTGLKLIVFNGLMKLTGRDIRGLNSVDEAKRWLYSVVN